MAHVSGRLVRLSLVPLLTYSGAGVGGEVTLEDDLPENDRLPAEIELKVLSRFTGSVEACPYEPVRGTGGTGGLNVP